MKRILVSVTFLLTVIILSTSFAAAQSSAGIAINYVDATNYPEVRVYATVLDARGAPVTGLNKGNFEVVEGGTPISLDGLSSQLDQMYVVIMLDTTGSMLDPDPTGARPIDLLKNSAVNFVQSMAPQDVVAVYTFDDHPVLRCEFTADRKVVTDCLNSININTRKDTALWDSAFAAVTKAADIPRGRRAVVLFTDGDDNLSQKRVDDVLNKARDSQIPVYTIAAGSEINVKDLKRLSEVTNGQSLTGSIASDLPNLFKALSNQLKNQYVLVYTSGAPEGRSDLKVRATFGGASYETVVSFPVPALQAAITPLLTQLDATQFPDIKAYLSVPLMPVGVPITPTQANILLQEDGNRISSFTPSPESRGAQITLLLDNRPDLNQKGATQRSLWTEMREALLELSDSSKWLDKQSARDTVSALAAVEDAARPNFAFTNDYTLLHNFAYSDKTPPSGAVSFDQLLKQGVDAINKSGSNDGRRRMMLVFSNGIPASVDSLKLQELAQVLKQNNISVFVVYFGPSEAPANAVNLKKIAGLAGWRYYWYTSLGSIQSVYQHIAGFRKQFAISYRSKTAASGNHRVRIAVRANEESKLDVSTENSYTLKLAPPEVQSSPVTGFVRRGDQWDTPVAETRPATLPISYTVTWPDAHPRRITRIGYVIDQGPEQTVSNPPADSSALELDISKVDDGQHTLQVTVQDELGLTSQSISVPVSVVIQLPAAPLPIEIYRRFRNALPYVALGASLVMLIAAIVIYRKSERVRQVVGGAVSTIKVATEFFVKPKEKDKKPPKAYLVPLSGADSTRGPIAIRSETIRLGRDESWANVTLAEATVSRLHAKILEEHDGAFRIFDEGSRGGTFVNDEEVGMAGQWLNDGDTISLGKDEFQFKLKLGPKEDTEVFDRPSSGDVSEEDQPVEEQVEEA